MRLQSFLPVVHASLFLSPLHEPPTPEASHDYISKCRFISRHHTEEALARAITVCFIMRSPVVVVEEDFKRDYCHALLRDFVLQLLNLALKK